VKIVGKSVKKNMWHMHKNGKVIFFIIVFVVLLSLTGCIDARTGEGVMTFKIIQYPLETPMNGDFAIQLNDTRILLYNNNEDKYQFKVGDIIKAEIITYKNSLKLYGSFSIKKVIEINYKKIEL
jgi:hypothetical protein